MFSTNTVCILCQYRVIFKPNLSVHSCKLQKHIIVYRMILKYTGSLIKKYPDWMHLSSTLYHTVMGLFWACLDIFLHVLNQQDLTAALQSDTITASKQQWVCHTSNSWCLRVWNNVCVCVCKIFSQPEETGTTNWWNN